MKYKIYTDGACAGNPGPGGWGAVIFDQKDIESYCDNLRSEIHGIKVSYENHEISITASGGVAITSESGNASDVINKADERLYDAKKSGRDKFVIN